MKHSKAAVIATPVILAILLLTPADIFSCGPFFTEAVFVSTKRPAPSIDDYLAGHLGVLQPTYYKVYLAIAYRVLSGKPITPAEIEKAKKFWNYDGQVNQDDDHAMGGWYVARAAALGEKAPDSNAETLPPSFHAYRRNPNTFNAYMNCPPDAFRTAASTVHDRAQRFGVGSATVRDWVTAQNAVFSNCDDDKDVPANAPPSADSLIKADRRYQIAAAHFYRVQYDEARAEFQQIAQDHASPWSTIAPYLAARTLIRQATVTAPADKPPDAKLLAQAETELKAILADKNAAALHPAVRRTLGFVEFRLAPEQRLHTLAKQISGDQPTPDLGQDLIDYTRLLDLTAVQTAEKAKAADDMTDWILTASDSSSSARAHAVERWQKTHAPAWLIAALVKSNANDPEVNALLKAAAAVPDDSPAHASASFQRARLLIAQQQTAEARALLDRELARVPAPPNQARNLLLALRWQVAQNFAEFVKFAPQVPVAYSDNDDQYCNGDNCVSPPGGTVAGTAALFDAPVATALNQRVPLDLLAEATRSDVLPQNLRQALLLAAWSRAGILDDASALVLSKQLGQEMPATAKYVNDYATAKDSSARQFAAAFAMLHLPGMRPYVNAGVLRETPLDKIDSYRDNWWCEDVGAHGVSNYEAGFSGEEADSAASNKSSTPPTASTPGPAFLSGEQQTHAAAEWKRLAQIGPAPNYFGKIVMAWAKVHPDDPRVPEALHLVVRATRYGCGNRDNANVSRQAFDLLHKQYPTSTWTKQTPHWFN